LAVLVEDLMEISRLDAKVAPMEWEPVELAGVAAGALDLRGWRHRVEVGAGAGEDEVTAAVHDSGPGIAPEHAGHLFERFYKADPARSRSSGSGTSLRQGFVTGRGDGELGGPSAARSPFRSPSKPAGAVVFYDRLAADGQCFEPQSSE